MLAKQEGCDLGGNAAQGLLVGIHHYPLAFDFSFEDVGLVHFFLSTCYTIFKISLPVTWHKIPSLTLAHTPERSPDAPGYRLPDSLPTVHNPPGLKQSRPGRIQFCVPYGTKM